MAARGAHDLANKKLKNALFAGLELGHTVRVFLDNFAGRLFKRARVVDLREAFRSYDFIGAAARFKHGGEDFFPDRTGDLAGLHEF